MSSVCVCAMPSVAVSLEAGSGEKMPVKEAAFKVGECGANWCVDSLCVQHCWTSPELARVRWPKIQLNSFQCFTHLSGSSVADWTQMQIQLHRFHLSSTVTADVSCSDLRVLHPGMNPH